MKQNLTDLGIRKLPSRDKRYDLWDAKVPNLGVRVFPSGAKSFFLSYYLHKRKRRATLGRYPELTLANARLLALERKAALARGENPALTHSNLTFKAVLSQFLELYCARHNKPSTQRSTMKLLENECLTPWATTPVNEITRDHILTVLDKMVARGSPGAANKCYAAISKFFSWSLSRGLVETNPCAAIQRPSKLNTRDRVLSDEEVRAVWVAAQQVGYPFGTIVSLLMTTAARRGEISNLGWEEIGNDAIHILDTKTNRPHYIPITPFMRTILNTIPHIGDNLFPATGSPERTFSGFGKCKQRLDSLCPLPHWTLHDLRRTAATHMAQLGVQPHIIERILNHQTGTISGVAAIYNRFSYLDDTKAALTLWHDKIQALSDGAN